MHVEAARTASTVDRVDGVDGDRAVDQLVDELSSRFHLLGCLLGEGTRSLPDSAIRDGAAKVVQELRVEPSSRTADAVLAALWPTMAMGDISEAWVRTPLGRLLADALAHRSARNQA